MSPLTSVQTDVFVRLYLLFYYNNSFYVDVNYKPSALLKQNKTIADCRRRLRLPFVTEQNVALENCRELVGLFLLQGFACNAIKLQ